jgi:hypothetical protein
VSTNHHQRLTTNQAQEDHEQLHLQDDVPRPLEMKPTYKHK